jgi:excisionase family DNA binding protein
LKDKKATIERIAFSKAEAAEMLGLCLRTIDNMIADKQLKTSKLGRRVLIPGYALYGLMGTFPPTEGTVRISYTKTEAAGALGVSVRLIDYLIAVKELKSRKVRGRVLIPTDSLHTLLRRDHKTLRAAA